MSDTQDNRATSNTTIRLRELDDEITEIHDELSAAKHLAKTLGVKEYENGGYLTKAERAQMLAAKRDVSELGVNYQAAIRERKAVRLELEDLNPNTARHKLIVQALKETLPQDVVDQVMDRYHVLEADVIRETDES